jgi:hypothetical protein
MSYFTVNVLLSRTAPSLGGNILDGKFSRLRINSYNLKFLIRTNLTAYIEVEKADFDDISLEDALRPDKE